MHPNAASRCHAWRPLGSAIVIAACLAACGSGSTSSTSGSTSSASSGAGGAGGAVAHPDPTASRATSPLAEGRSHHTATLLTDGRVVVVGGETSSAEPIASIEAFDPSTESWTTWPSLPEPRSNHTTTLLDDGRLLIVGGGRSNQNGSPSPNGVLSTAVLYNPADGSAGVVQLGGPRAGHQALPLPNGDVLVVGGSNDQFGSACTSVPNCAYGKALATAERFDVASSAFSPTSPMAGPRMLFGALLLADGTPLMIGGASDTSSLTRVEGFAADSDAFSPRASLAKARFRPVVARLGSGVVLAAAGKVANVGPIGVTELYDPIADAWKAGPDIGTPRTASAAVTLQSGNALVVGGFNQITGQDLDEALIFDQSSVSWAALPPLIRKRALPTATLLKDGRVLIVGGSGGLADCEITE